MAEMVLDIKTLPKTITMTAFAEEKPRFGHFFGMFKSNGSAVDEFLAEKHKELELDT